MIGVFALLLLPSADAGLQGPDQAKVEELARIEAGLRTQVEGIRLVNRLKLSHLQARLLLRCAEEGVEAREQAERERQQRRSQEIAALRAFRHEDILDRGFSKKVEAAAARYSRENRALKKALGNRLEYLESVFCHSLTRGQLLCLGDPDRRPKRAIFEERALGIEELARTLVKSMRQDRKPLFVRQLRDFMRSALEVRRLPVEFQAQRQASALFEQMQKSKTPTALAKQQVRSWIQKTWNLQSAHKELKRTGRILYGGGAGKIARLIFQKVMLSSLQTICERAGQESRKKKKPTSQKPHQSYTGKARSRGSSR